MSQGNKKLRVNFEIKAPMIRLIDDEGKMLGLFQVADAVRMAYDKGLDLIEIAPDANPPTCKMMDFGKYKYQLKKKAAESKKKQTVITIKEIQFRPNTDQHDVDYKVRHIQEFLKDGDKCRIIVTFRGREVTHSEIGRALLNKIIATLGDSCVIEQAPLIEGKRMSMLVAPPGTPVAKPVGKPMGARPAHPGKVPTSGAGPAVGTSLGSKLVASGAAKPAATAGKDSGDKSEN